MGDEGRQFPTSDEISAHLLANGVELSAERVEQVIRTVNVRPMSLRANLLPFVRWRDAHDTVMRPDLVALLRKFYLGEHYTRDELGVLVLRFGLYDGICRNRYEVSRALGIGVAKTKKILRDVLKKLPGLDVGPNKPRHSYAS